MSNAPISTALGETMVVAILGRKRSGKTLLAAKLCYEYWLAGGRVMHMGNLSFGEPIEDISILTDQDPAALSEVLLYVDEVKAILNSRRSGSAFQQLIFNNLMQAGHQGLSMIFTSQFQTGISGDLLDQCDYAIMTQPDSGATKWRHSDGYTTKGKLVKANLCPGFDKKSPYYHEHAGSGKVLACAESEETRWIRYTLTTQASHPLGAGIRKYLTLWCAQRFYPLSDTTFKVDAREAMLFNTDEIRGRREAENLDSFKRLLVGMSEQHNIEVGEVGLVHEYVHNTEGMPPLDLRTIKSFMRSIGVKTISSRDHRFKISEWVNKQ
tara:strand:- start:3127 stop:4098 length:972 start_codon:yes stop_codon:yes gene_type:complete